MLPMLLPLVLNIAPEIAKWLFGDTAETVTAKVADAVSVVTGTTDQAAAMAALESNPQAVSDLRVKLAQIAADHDKAAATAASADLAARLFDVANARQQTINLAKAGSGIAWGAPIVSVVVMASFGTSLYAVLTHALPTGSETVANVMLGTLGSLAAGVVSYWVGSSAGSDSKTEMLYRSTPAASAANTADGK